LHARAAGAATEPRGAPHRLHDGVRAVRAPRDDRLRAVEERAQGRAHARAGAARDAPRLARRDRRAQVGGEGARAPEEASRETAPPVRSRALVLLEALAPAREVEEARGERRLISGARRRRRRRLAAGSREPWARDPARARAAGPSDRPLRAWAPASPRV